MKKYFLIGIGFSFASAAVFVFFSASALAVTCPDFNGTPPDYCPTMSNATRCSVYGQANSCAPQTNEITPAAHTSLSCDSCTFSCASGWVACNNNGAVNDADGCETQNQVGQSCTTSGGNPGRWIGNPCSVTCEETPPVKLGIDSIRADNLLQQSSTPKVTIDAVGILDVTADVKLGGDIYLVNGRALRVDGAGTTALNLGNWGAGATGFSAHIFGGLLADGNITSGGTIEGDFVAAGGISCGENEILKKVSGSWQCSSVSGAVVNETDPIFTAWQTAPTLASLSMTGELIVAGYATPPASGAGNGSLIYDSTAGTLKFWNGNTWKSVVADGAGPASPWATSGNDIYNVNTGNVGIGIISPAERLEVTAGTGAVARLRVSDFDSGQNPEIQLEYADGSHWAVYADKADSDKLKFWRGTSVFEIDGNGNIVAAGSIRANGCFGPVFTQASATASTGNVGGYNGANAQCPAGAHVCTTGEMLNSINCGANLSSLGGSGAWVSIGIASLPTPSNDCNGWVSDDAGWQGVHYVSSGTGGNFYARACSDALPFACCR